MFHLFVLNGIFSRSMQLNYVTVMLFQIARFKRQRAAESKLLEIKERKERRGRSTRAAAISTVVSEEEEISDDDGEEEREVSCFSLKFHDVILREREREKRINNSF